MLNREREYFAERSLISLYLTPKSSTPHIPPYQRLIRTLKEEEVHLNDYKDVMEARDRIGHFITQVYHQKRPHSALGNHLTPVEFQRKNLS